jgi:hypothetical protein
MSHLDFKPNECRKCGNLVWEGISATSAFNVKLDMNRLNLVQEILALTAGIATYQIHRTAISFEATRRMAGRMNTGNPVVLATHTCKPITEFGQTPPDYFNTAKLPTTDSEEVPF